MALMVELHKKMTGSLLSDRRAGFCCLLGSLLLALMLLAGCETTEPEPTEIEPVAVVRPPSMTLLVIGDDQLGKIIARQWSARQDGDLNVITQSTDEFEADNYQLSKETDIVIYPTGMLGELESRDEILELPRWLWDSEELNRKELLRHHRLSLIRHGDASWAVPLGSPQLALIYNVDTLKKLNQPPPENWEQLRDLSNRLNNNPDLSNDEGDRLPTGIAIPLANGWAAQMFLARAAPLIRNRGKLSTVFDRRTMQPLITAPPFQKALEDLKLLVSKPVQFDLTPSQVFQNVLTHRAAIAITWPGKHGSDETADTASSSANVGITSVPGSSQWYDIQNKKWNQRPKEDSQHVDLIGFSGLVASASKNSRHAKWAFRFLEWLSSKPISLITVVDSPRSGPFRASHLGDPTRWTDSRISEEAARQYATVIRNCNDQTVVLMFPRLLGREEYLEVLDRYVRESLEGKLEPMAALKLVAERWEEITEEKGRQLQIAQLRRDAGL